MKNSSNLVDALNSHAANFSVNLDASFVDSVVAGIKNLGALNPKIPDSFCQAGPKTISPKVPAANFLPGISALSVPLAQRYDWVAGNARLMPAFRFLVTPFDYQGTRLAVVDLSEEIESAMSSIVGPDFAMCSLAIKAHLNRQEQNPFVAGGEKQVFWPVDPGQNKYLIVSPTFDMLPIELASRLRERSGQKFPLLWYRLSSEKFQNAGVAACNLGGKFPKLLALPPEPETSISALPSPVSGRFLAVAVDVQSMNATGASISAGLANLPQALGFMEALRRQLAMALGEATAFNAVALGFSKVDFHGHENEGSGEFSYFVKRASRVSSKKEAKLQRVAEQTANAKVHLVLELSEEKEPDFLRFVATALDSLRYGGGTIWNPEYSLAANPENFFAAWGDSVYFLADAAKELSEEEDRLDQALDFIDLSNSFPSAASYCLAVCGYQGIEPPRPRAGLRDQLCRHIFAASILSLCRWVPASESTAESVFWKSFWDNETYSAYAKVAKYE